MASVSIPAGGNYTIIGVPVGSNDMGTFTGTIIPDNSDIKEALQALETASGSGGGGGNSYNPGGW